MIDRQAIFTKAVQGIRAQGGPNADAQFMAAFEREVIDFAKTYGLEVPAHG